MVAATPLARVFARLRRSVARWVYRPSPFLPTPPPLAAPLLTESVSPVPDRDSSARRFRPTAAAIDAADAVLACGFGVFLVDGVDGPLFSVQTHGPSFRTATRPA
jgi:hypothetical protein